MTIQYRTTRRGLATLAALALVLAACGGGSPTTSAGGSGAASQSQSAVPEPNELTVLEWAGYEAPDFWTDFASANPDTDVQFEFGINDADILSLMEAGSEADVFHFYTGWQQFYVDEGLVQPIDTSKLTNWDKVPDEFKAMGQIDGVQYYVPWDWGFTSILYNTEKVDEVTSWDALFNPDYDQHISMWDDGPAAVTVSSYINGWDETAITDEQLATIEQDWKDQKPLNLHYWDSRVREPLPGGRERRHLGRLRLAGLLRASALRGHSRSRMPTRRKVATRGWGCTGSAPRATARSWRCSSWTTSSPS